MLWLGLLLQDAFVFLKKVPILSEVFGWTKGFCCTVSTPWTKFAKSEEIIAHNQSPPTCCGMEIVLVIGREKYNLATWIRSLLYISSLPGVSVACERTDSSCLADLSNKERAKRRAGPRDVAKSQPRWVYQWHRVRCQQTTATQISYTAWWHYAKWCQHWHISLDHRVIQGGCWWLLLRAVSATCHPLRRPDGQQCTEMECQMPLQKPWFQYLHRERSYYLALSHTEMVSNTFWNLNRKTWLRLKAVVPNHFWLVTH